MSRYVVEIETNGVRQGWLLRGRIGKRRDTASAYPHPSNARQAVCSFEKRKGSAGTSCHIVDRRTGKRIT